MGVNNANRINEPSAQSPDFSIGDENDNDDFIDISVSSIYS